MKVSRLLSSLVVPVAACAVLGIAGCSSSVAPEEEHQPTVLKRAVDRGTDIEVASNINQINQALSMVKSDNDGKAPATLEQAKAAAKVPAEMWIDGVTGKPLVYDPVSGTVHREGAAANTPPIAGSLPSNSRLPAGSGGF